MHPFEPVPILAEPGVAIGRRLRQQTERGAPVGYHFGELRGELRPRLLAEQREGELVACIQKRNAVLAFAGSVGNPSHLLGVDTIVRGDRLAPPRGLGESRVAIEA